MSAADTAKKTATGLAGYAWKGAKLTLMAGAAFSLISLTGGSAALAAAGPGLGSLVGVPIEGIGEAAEGISASVEWATGHLQGAAAAAADSAATLQP